MRILSLLFTLFMVLVGVSFAIINANSVTMNYYIGELTLPLSMLLIFTFTLGVLVGVLAMLPKIFNLKRQLWHCKPNANDKSDRDANNGFSSETSE